MACCAPDIRWCHMTFCPDTCPKFSAKFNLRDVGQIIKCQPCKTNLLHCDLNLGISLWSSLMRAPSSQCRTTTLSQWQYKGQFIWSGLQVLYLLHMNLTTQQKQHWVNRDDGAVPFSTLFWFFCSSCLHSNLWCPRPGHLIRGSRPA